LLADLAHHGTQSRHLPRRRELLRHMLGIELVGAAGIERELAELARGVAIEEKGFELNFLIALKLRQDIVVSIQQGFDIVNASWLAGCYSLSLWERAGVRVLLQVPQPCCFHQRL